MLLDPGECQAAETETQVADAAVISDSDKDCDDSIHLSDALSTDSSRKNVKEPSSSAYKRKASPKVSQKSAPKGKRAAVAASSACAGADAAASSADQPKKKDKKEKKETSKKDKKKAKKKSHT